MKRFLPACITVLLLCGLLIQSASAFSRRYLPLPKAVSAADTIAVVQPVKILGSRTVNVGKTVQVEVIDVLKGKANKGRVWVQLDKMHIKAFGKLTTTKKWIFFMSAGKDTPTLKVMLDGTTRYNPAVMSKINAAVNKTTSQPAR